MKNILKIKLNPFSKKVITIALLFWVLLPVSVFSQNGTTTTKTAILRGGTTITLAFSEAVTSKNKGLQEGSSVNLYVVYDVVADGLVVIPAGTAVRGEIVNIERRRNFGRPGSMSIKIDKVQAVDNTIMTLAGNELSFTGRANATSALFMTTASTCSIVGLFVYWPLSIIAVPLFIPPFFIKGGYAVIPSGKQIQATIINNAKIAAPDSEM